MLFRAVLLISFLCIAICLAAKDYYEVLGVERGAPTAQIKRAFKKLALKHHPDKSDDPKASEKFMEITTAYETLFNEDKRKAYDRMGHEAYVQSKKKGGTPEEEAAFTSFFRQSTASSPDHEGYFESFDKFFSGSFGPGHGGVFFGADGAPMFQVDPQVPNQKNFFRTKAPEFEFLGNSFPDFDAKHQEQKPQFDGTGFYRIADEPLMFDPANEIAEMLFSEMRAVRREMVNEHYRRLPNAGYHRVRTVHKRGASATRSVHVTRAKAPSLQATRVNKRPHTHSFRSETHPPFPHDSNLYNSFTSSHKATPSACRTGHCHKINRTSNRNGNVDREAHSSTVKAKDTLPETLVEEQQIHNFDFSYYLSEFFVVCHSARNSTREALLSLCEKFLAWLGFYLAIFLYSLRIFLFICASFALLQVVYRRIWH